MAEEVGEAEEAAEEAVEGEGEDTPLHNHNSRSQQPQMSKQWENSLKSSEERSEERRVGKECSS